MPVLCNILTKRQGDHIYANHLMPQRHINSWRYVVYDVTIAKLFPYSAELTAGPLGKE